MNAAGRAARGPGRAAAWAASTASPPTPAPPVLIDRLAGGPLRHLPVQLSGDHTPSPLLSPPIRVRRAPVNRLITELARLPGIGQRTAQRLAFHILRASEEEALALADAIREVKATVGHCEVCFNLATEATCRICQDERREPATICVVEQPSDVIPIERSGEFHGRYHVLGGALSPIDGVDPEDLHIASCSAGWTTARACARS